MEKITLYKKTLQSGRLSLFAKKLFMYTTYTIITAALLFLPFSFSINDCPVGSKPAFAGPGGGGGNAGGNAGGKGGGSSNGVGNAAISSNGNAHGYGNASKSNHGAIASELGNLNAAHASPQAMANAADDSIVGRISIALANYYDTFATDEDAAMSDLQIALGKISNKPVEDPKTGVSPEVAAAVVKIAEAKSEP